MKVSAQIAWEFDSISISRGIQRFQAGGVDIEMSPSGEITSDIDGCHVTIFLRGRSLEMRGSCREFAQARQCRHEWAALLAAEEQGLLEPPIEGRVHLL